MTYAVVQQKVLDTIEKQIKKKIERLQKKEKITDKIEIMSRCVNGKWKEDKMFMFLAKQAKLNEEIIEEKIKQTVEEVVK